MMSPRFSIVYRVRAGPHGGANQFLKALKAAFARAGADADDPGLADVILFNSHHDLDCVAAAKRAKPKAVFIHRVDGPMRLYNEPGDRRDAVVARANRWLADATVFQSEWSRRANEEMGFRPAPLVAVIGNAADPAIFNRERARPPLSGPRVRLVATSWSKNPNKGFDVYDHLDRHLDFSRFEMVFVGDSPISFRNIRHLPPCPSEDLARQLKESDIFVTGSRADPCSNSLVEALSCGLPAVARRDGGHAELLGGAGELFDAAVEVPALIERIVGRYGDFVARIAAPGIDAIARRYLDFAGELKGRVAAGRLRPRGWGIARRAAWRLFGLGAGAA